MVSTHLKNISPHGNLPQVGMKIKKYLKNIWNHHPAQVKNRMISGQLNSHGQLPRLISTEGFCIDLIAD